MSDTPPENPAEEVTAKVHFGERYHRNRPFLVINTAALPRVENTHVKGWGDTESNWNIAERAYIVDRVSNKMMQEATFIIDIINNTVIKNRHSEQSDAETVMKHFMPKYSQEIMEGMERWAQQNKPVPKVTVVDDEN